jgi:hypothetical protein
MGHLVKKWPEFRGRRRDAKTDEGGRSRIFASGFCRPTLAGGTRQRHGAFDDGTQSSTGALASSNSGPKSGCVAIAVTFANFGKLYSFTW